MIDKNYVLIPLVLLLCGCTQNRELRAVTVKEFRLFVTKTNYITDAEKYGWSFVQKDILGYDIQEGVSWRDPMGNNLINDDFPVTQVSFNDALAYCAWSNSKLPDYQQYWRFAKDDPRKININSNGIEVSENVSIVGNVWDITVTENKKGEIRLAGGSYLCSQHTCDGSNPERKLFVDKSTGNSHIGFSVLR